MVRQNYLVARSVLVLCGALWLGLTGCVFQPQEPDTCDAPGVLFQDDFSGEQSCGWVTFSRPGASAAIENEAMQLSISQPGQVWWTNPGRNFDDVVITAEARQVDGPNNNAYGLICRYQNEANFYVFLVSGDGYYAIGKYQSGNDTVTYLTEGQQFQESDAINRGVASNELTASCIGNELSLEVNGVPLVTLTDPTFVTGDIGVAAGTLEPGMVVVQFDDVRVTAP